MARKRSSTVSLDRHFAEKQRIAMSRQKVVKDEARLIAALNQRFEPHGWRLEPLGVNDTVWHAGRLQCPKCERTFAHPLPMRRHVKATHDLDPVSHKPLHTKKPVAAKSEKRRRPARKKK